MTDVLDAKDLEPEAANPASIGQREPGLDRRATPRRKLTIDVSADLHRRIITICATRRIPVNQAVRDVLEQAFRGDSGAEAATPEPTVLAHRLRQMTIRDTPQTDRNITAFFDTRDHAEQAIETLTSSGVPRDKMLLRAGAARSLEPVDTDKSLLAEVKELVLPSETPSFSAETMRHEGFLLTIRPDAEGHDPVMATLKEVGALNVETRTDIWPIWKSDPDSARTGGAEHEASL